ncbi:cyclin-dependent kinase inhibitor 3 family protein [Vibrio tapetis]|uniref:Tyrosine specific protein phosphatases domain-containing protein n=1 Tax=Vibrio tapetis subsp. tapetis TaxID=1671868 RepID=A0A2N8ZHF5_9VIBR|nr:cyclin-dependent kinase inhibitor 3 family protein [Vibrio tapetis]SON51338.1 Predicted protein-tyrosine phosphatase [Vibrio tapetis subsp. tapetis]
MEHPVWSLATGQQQAALILTPCPGTKGVELAKSLGQLKAQGVKAVVTAINNEEMQSKGVRELGALTEELGMAWHHIVIEDDQAPGEDFSAKWQQASPSLQALLANGDKVALHCMGGSGRTGLLAAHLLLEQGWPLDKIISQVQALRPGAFTKAVQQDYIQSVANSK